MIWVPALGALAIGGAGVFMQLWQRSVALELAGKRTETDFLRSELRQQSQAIDSFADGLEVAILICDFRGSVAYANKRSCEMFRFENPVGRSVLATTLSYDLEQLVLHAVQCGDPCEKEVVFPPPDERVALAKAWISQDQQRVFLSVFEVTNLRRLERVRRDFVANVSHELRTPMSIIRAYAETLLDDDPPDAEIARRYLPRIIEEVDRLSGITQDLLVLSASESEQVQKHTCDLGGVVCSTVAQLTKKAEDKGLVLEYHGPTSLKIEASTAQMTQVAMNLIDNAINYTVHGRVDVFVQPQGDRVTMRVRDSGIGIAMDHLGRIFERFYRVDKGRSRSTGGTGLGLSIVKHIVEAHDGTVGVKSALNEGTEFEVRLPIGRVAADHPTSSAAISD